MDSRFCWGVWERASHLLPSPQFHKLSPHCSTAVTIAVLIITGKWRPNHLAMGSRPPGVQHSHPPSSKGFAEENSTGRSLGQHFPGCLSPTPSASSSSSTHPNCPIKEQPPYPTQAATKVIPLGSFKGKRTGKVWIPPLLPISDWGPRLACLGIRLFFYARMKFPSWKKNSSLWREKASKSSAFLNRCHRLL